MYKRLLILLLIIAPIVNRANMAQPYFEGTQHAAVYGNEKYRVLHEIIDIHIQQDTTENRLYAVFKIHYKVQSPGNVVLPLLFLALGKSGTQLINVNGKALTNQQPTKQDIKQFPFVSKSNADNGEPRYSAAYTKDERIAVRLEDLIYFDAPLDEGENDIYIEYAADFGFDTYGFLQNYTLKYSLYPSKFWKSFGPIKVNLHLNGLADLTTSNLGKATFKSDTAEWILRAIDTDLEIIINHKTSLLAKGLLLLHPFGIAFLSFIAIAFFHLRLIKRYPTYSNWLFWLGIFIVSALFYTVFFLSFDLIEWVLGYNSKHGYVFLYVVTYPFFVLLYGILLSFWKRKKLSKSV